MLFRIAALLVGALIVTASVASSQPSAPAVGPLPPAAVPMSAPQADQTSTPPDVVAEFNAINAAARAAREHGDTASYVANVRKLAAFTPDHPGLQVALARGMGLKGDRSGAIAQLNKIADLGFSFDAGNDTAFQRMKDDPGFVAAAERLAENGKGTGRSKGIIKL